MTIEKSISYQIESQFPSIYRESGRELIDIVKEYYAFSETEENQSIYNARKMFEFRDIDTTLAQMLIFFKNKYLADLPYNDQNIRFIVKNIIDLYRRRGSEDGLRLFFKMFYNENISIYYPGVDILKPSSSEWTAGKFLQMFPATDVLELRSIIGKTIFGSVSKAEAVVDRINFFLLNNTLTPVIFIDNVAGEFAAFDTILSLNEDGILESFGKVNGSLDGFQIDASDPLAKTGYLPGEILDCACAIGTGAKVIVTEVSENFTGEIIYSVVEGGFGYTTENTLLLVSNQTLFVNNNPNTFVLYETLEDQFGNRGIVIGWNDIIVGVRMEDGMEFVPSSIIETVDRSVNITIPVTEVVAKNGSSPGPLYPEIVTSNTATPQEIDDSVRAVIDNEETVFLITDIIGNYLDVPLNAADYSAPPALQPMSGNASPINLSTPINEAFDLAAITLGRLVRFDHINPGSEYTNRVFVAAIDPAAVSIDRVDQIMSLQTINSSFSVGETVTQNGIMGIIRRIIGTNITITPYSYEGFNGIDPITFRGNTYNVLSATRDYSSKKYGDNAIINAITDFAVGKVQSVSVLNSGFGYINGSRIRLRDESGEVAAIGVVSARKQGVSEGFWRSFDSHMNIYDNKRLQDSFYYQDYSYEISSETGINKYEQTLKDIAHPAGMKPFGKFLLSREENVNSTIRAQLDF